MKVALYANAQGVREELIEALADALVADIEQCPVLPMPVPVPHEGAGANGVRIPARSGIMRPEPAGGVGRPPRRPIKTGGTR